MDGLIEGRIVHYVCPGEIHRAALVVNVVDKDKGICDLFVFSMPQDGQGGFFMRTEARHSTGPVEGTWHWIERA